MCVPLHNLESAPVTLSMARLNHRVQSPSGKPTSESANQSAGCENASLSQPIPESFPPCLLVPRLLPQCCDQHRAWNRVQRFDSCPPSWFRERFPLTRLNIVTVVVSHTETVPPFQIPGVKRVSSVPVGCGIDPRSHWVAQE